MNRRILFALPLVAPAFFFAACGGDDVLLFPDAGPDASPDGAMMHDGTAGDAPTSSDAPMGTDAPSAKDAGTDAKPAPDAGQDAPSDAPAAQDAPVDAPATTDAGTDAGNDASTPDASPPADADVDATLPVDAGVDATLPVDAGVDATTPVDAGVDAPVIISDATIDVQVFDGGMCNDLANGGNAVQEIQVPADAPTTGTGGTISTGLYYLVGWQTFTGTGGATGPTGNTRKTAFYFYPTTYLKVTADNGGVDENDTRDWRIDSSDPTTLVSTQTCPTADNLTSYFSVNGNLLILNAGTEQLTFQHQ